MIFITKVLYHCRSSLILAKLFDLLHAVGSSNHSMLDLGCNRFHPPITLCVFFEDCTVKVCEDEVELGDVAFDFLWSNRCWLG